MPLAVSSISGAVLTINCFRFKIVHADAAVYRYMQENPEMFSPEVIEGVRRDVSAASGAHPIEEVIPIFVPFCSHIININDSIFRRHHRRPPKINVAAR